MDYLKKLLEYGLEPKQDQDLAPEFDELVRAMDAKHYKELREKVTEARKNFKKLMNAKNKKPGAVWQDPNARDPFYQQWLDWIEQNKPKGVNLSLVASNYSKPASTVDLNQSFLGGNSSLVLKLTYQGGQPAVEQSSLGEDQDVAQLLEHLDNVRDDDGAKQSQKKEKKSAKNSKISKARPQQ